MRGLAVIDRHRESGERKFERKSRTALEENIGKILCEMRTLSSLTVPYTKAKESHSYKQCFSTPHAVATEFMIQNIYQPEVHIFYYTADTRHSVEGRWEVMRETVK